MENEIRIEFNKRFANGEQNLILSSQGIIEEPIYYFWYKKEIYNHILPIVEMIKSKYKVTDEQLYGENGLVERLIPIQRAYNAIKNATMSAIERTVLVYRSGAEKPSIQQIDFHLEEMIKEEELLLYEFDFIQKSFVTILDTKY